MQNNSGFRTFTAGAAALKKGTRVVISGSTVVAGDATSSNTVGFVESDVLANSLVAIKLIGTNGTFEAIVDGAVTAGSVLYPHDSGKLSTTPSGNGEFIALDTATADNEIIEVVPIPQQQGVRRVVFDPSAVAAHATVGAKTFGVSLPAGAVITGFFYDVTTAFTSATSAATIAFSVEAANDLLNAIAINSGTTMFAAGRHVGLPGFPALGLDAAHDTQVEVAALVAATYVKTTAVRSITATVAVEALTAGRAVLHIAYSQS